MSNAMLESALTSLTLLARGKVRDNYLVGTDKMLMVATDRLSAFDVVMNQPIPGKGKLLTQMAQFWFSRLADIVPNHLTNDEPTSVVSAVEAEQVRERSMVVRRLTPLPIEAVVRGYLAGSGWQEYRRSGCVCGVPLPPGLKNAERLSEPIFTPAIKADAGDHDQNIDFERTCQLVGEAAAEEIRRVSLRLYSAASSHALQKGLIIADTKFEFGFDKAGVLTLMDEVLTPDSSRYWPVEGYVAGGNPLSFDKQFVRDWLEAFTIGGLPWNKKAPAPDLPDEVVARTAQKYQEAMIRLLG